MTVTAASADLDAVTVTPTVLTFTTGNWATAQTVTVTALDDDDAVDETVDVSYTAASTDTAYNNLTGDVVTVTVTDDEGVTIVLAAGLMSPVGEGGTGTYTVVLDSEPSETVTVTATSGDLDAVTVTPTVLTFTTGNWDTAQTVTVTALDDDDADDESVDVLHTAASSDDAAYNNLAGDVVTVTVTDNDEVGVTVVPDTGLPVGEGGTGSYTVVLDSEPSGAVTVTAASADLGAVTVTPPVSLTFTPGNWATAQTVTVTALDDDDADDESVDVSHTAASSDDAAYNNLAGDVVTVTVDDDEVAGVTIVLAAGLMSPVGEGGTGTYTVVLASEPSETVTVTATSGDLDAVTVTPTVLTFTTGNWATAQTVTVTAEQDNNAVDETVDVSYTAASTDTAYNNLTGDVVTVTVTDDEGVTIVLAAGLMSPVGEGGTGTYTVVLDSEPSETVTVTATSGDLDAVTVTPTVLTFTTGNWDTAQTVTVTALDDDDADDESVDVLHTAASADDAAYNNLAGDVVTVTVTDNDEVGVTVVPDTGLPVGEGGTGSYTVVLDSEPSGAVTVTAASADLGAVTVTPPVSLTFTPGNWATAQTVTVTALDDDDADDESVDVSHTAASSDDAAYNNLAGDVVTVTVDDDEVAGVTIVLAAGLMSPVGEGGTGSYTVVLASEPSETVTVTATSGDLDAVTVSPTVLTFTTGNWATAQTVTVTAEQDNNAVDETVDVSYTAASTDTAYNNLTGDVVTVTVTDDEGVTIVLAAGLMSPVGEGGTGTYTVVLDSQPSETVTVTATSGDLDAVTVTPTVLTFTTGNWATAQTVTVTAEQDNNAVDETVDVSYTAASTDTAYNNLAGDVVTVTVTDNDEVGVTIVLAASLMSPVGEGGTGTYTVVLASEPSETVTVTATSGDLDAVTVSPTVLTFTTGNWATAQTVTVTAEQDNNAVDETVDVSYTAASTDTAYNNLTGDVVTVTVTDDEGVTIVLAASLMSPVGEGGTGTYTVVLASEPSETVTVTATSGDLDAVTVSPTVLTFTTGNWATAQTVTVTAEQDNNAVDESVDVSYTAASTDTAYNNLTGDVVTVTVTDDEVAGVTIVLAAGLMSPVGEGGTGTYTVVLASEPSETVTVTATSGDLDAVTVSPTVLTFTTGNWATAQTVTVTAEQDNNAVDETVDVSYTAASTDTAYNNLAGDVVTVTVTDDEVAGVTIVLAAGLMSPVGEGGTGTYTVVLASEPSETVTVTATSGDLDAVTVSPTVLTFTTGNWATAQTVTVTAEQDNNAVDETVDVSYTAASTDTAYNLTGDVVTVTVDDDEVAAVSVSFGASAYSVSEGGTTAAVTVELSAFPGRQVVVPITVTNQGDTSARDYTTVPAAVTFAADAKEQSFTFAAVDDRVDDDGESVVLSFGELPYRVDAGTPATATVTIADNDTAGVTVVSDTGLSFDKDGTATYTVVLDSQPAGDVTVTISVVSGATLASYTISVISGATRASYTPSVISGATRASYTPSVISGATRASYTPSVISGATRASYTPVAADVTEFLKAFVSPDAVTVSPSVLTFTSKNWDTPQTVTVRAMDGIVTDDETIEVSHTVTSADGGYDDFAAAKQMVRAAPPDPALNVGRLGLFWRNSTTGNTLWGDSCIGRRSFFVIWTGPEGNNKRADEWGAEIRTHRGAGQVIYDFRRTLGTTGYYEMYGTVEFQGTGSLSLNVRGRFGQRWGTWSPTGSLYCSEVQRPTRD